MPKQELDGEELYQLALAIVGLVLKTSDLTVSDLADHFLVSEKVVVKAVRAIANSEDLDRYQTHFYVDEDSLEQGLVSFGLGQGSLESPPVMSHEQLAAITMGLEYLSSLPEFSENEDLLELRKLIGSGDTVPVQAGPRVQAEQVHQLREAVVNQVRAEFSYVNQTGKRSRRVVEPLRIDLIGSKHYLRAFCLTTNELRSFRIERMTELALSSESVSEQSKALEVPDEVYGNGGGVAVSLSASESAAEIFWNFPVVGEVKRTDAGLEGEILVGSLPALARHVVRYGGAVRVLSPQAARDLVREFALQSLGEAGVGEE